jgi:hypothetical protein
MQAFRDWGVVLTDWQSQCSMLADAAEGGLAYTSRRMMPTVGCEADAIAYEENLDRIFLAGEGGDAVTVGADGGYSHADPADLSLSDCLTAALQHCLVLATGQRMRLVHNLKRMGAEGAWCLVGVEVHRERYDSPHTGRRVLIGCGGGMEPFATTARLERAALEGAWSGTGLRYEADGQGAVSCTAVEGQQW